MTDARSFWRLYSLTQIVWSGFAVGLAVKFGWRYLALIALNQIFINACFVFVDGMKDAQKFILAKRFLVFTNVLVPVEAYIVLLIAK